MAGGSCYYIRDAGSCRKRMAMAADADLSVLGTHPPPSFPSSPFSPTRPQHGHNLSPCHDLRPPLARCPIWLLTPLNVYISGRTLISGAVHHRRRRRHLGQRASWRAPFVTLDRLRHYGRHQRLPVAAILAVTSGGVTPSPGSTCTSWNVSGGKRGMGMVKVAWGW